MTATPQPSANPYVGPRAFRYGETLYGRDREVMELFDLLIAERIVLLYSPSGAGKTSLMQAALIPALEKEDFQVLPVMRVSLEPSPGLERLPTTNRYVLSVLLSLEEALPAEQQMSLAELARMKLADYLDQREAGPEALKPSVLIFDQFEEILTVDHTDRAAKEAFFAQVGTALRARHRWALFAMREEYSAGLDPYLRPIPTRLHTTFRLELLGEDAACLAMQRPACQAHVKFTDAAARKLANDLRRVRLQGPAGTTEVLGLYVEPVHLQVVCHRLWERLLADDKEIGEEDVEVIGDVDSALAGYYVQQVAAIAGETGVSERSIREWFDRQLITTQGIRGQVLQDQERSQGLENRAIERLVDAHLVRAEKRRGATWFELAHDRLIEPVRQNNAVWYQTNLSALQLQADLWERQGRPGGLLLRDQAWVEAEQWATAHQDELTDTERDFLTACRDAQAIAEREQRQARLIRWWARIATLICCVAVLALLWAGYQTKKAREGRDAANHLRLVSIIQGLAAQAPRQQNQGRKDEGGALLARQAYLINQRVHGYGQDQVNYALRDQVNYALRAVLSRAHFSHILHSSPDVVFSITFSPDGKTLAWGSSDHTVRLWDPSNPSAAPTILRGHTGSVRSVAFSPDGKTLASGSSDKTVRLWDLSNPSAAPRILQGHADSVRSVAFSPDGKILASGSYDDTIRLWELSNPSAAPTILQGHSGNIMAVTFSPDGKMLASGGEDAKVLLWNLGDFNTAPTPLSGHTGAVRSVAFSPDGKTLASGSEDTTIRLWGLSNLGAAPPFLRARGRSGHILAVAFSPDGKTLAAGSEDTTMQLWAVGAPDTDPTILHGHTGLVRSVAFSPDGKTLASASFDKTIRLWELSNPRAELHILQGHADSVRSVAFSPDGKTLASGSYDDTMRLWELSNLDAASTIVSGHAGNVLAVAFSPDGKMLASASSDKTVRLWDLSNLTAAPTILKDHQGLVLAVAFSPDGKMLASASSDKTVRLWDLSNLTAAPRILPDHVGNVLAVAFSPDGKMLASGGDDAKVLLWNLELPNAAPIPLSGHTGAVRSVAFSTDGNKTLASGSDDTTMRLWKLSDLSAAPLILHGHEGPVRAIAFSPDGETLASGSEDTTMRLWAMGDPNADPIILHDHAGPIRTIAFSPDGKTKASGSDDKNILLWTATTDEMLAERICEKVWRNLTVQEWRQFVGKGIPYERTCPKLPIHPSVAGEWVEKGRLLAKQGKVKEAIAAYVKAQKLDSTLKISAKPWETLCWFGSLWGYAKDVMNACEQAVMLAPEDYGIRDSRGLARALTGNTDGAIADFQAFVNLTPHMEKKSRRQRWIDTLRAGKNPFTPEEIETLRKP